jgi:hypothetical protein
LVVADSGLEKGPSREHIQPMNTSRVGWIVIAGDRDKDESLKRFAVYTSNIDAAMMLVAQKVPERRCYPERPLYAKEASRLGLKPDECEEL